MDNSISVEQVVPFFKAKVSSVGMEFGYIHRLQGVYLLRFTNIAEETEADHILILLTLRLKREAAC
jgi:hypothetical protein